MRSRDGIARNPMQARDRNKAASPGCERDEHDCDDDEADEADEESRFVYDDEDVRRDLGERYEEFKARFEYALNDGNLEDLVALADDFGELRFRSPGSSR